MSDLVEFLRARLDEDEQAARACEYWAPSPWVGTFKQVTSEPAGEETRTVANTVAREVSHHVDRHQPRRVLAEVEAKRRIIAEVLAECAAADFDPLRGIYGKTLRLLALPYADHPDYREEWKP